MNIVYESPTMVVNDDREPLDINEACYILLKGGSVEISDPPDYTAENEHQIFGFDERITMDDILTRLQVVAESEDEQIKIIIQYLSGYDIYK